MSATQGPSPGNEPRQKSGEEGFSLAEFLMSSLILLVVAASIFAVLNEIQREAGYQTETQSALNNARIALQTVERFLRQAGNDPLASGLQGITIISSTEVQVRSDTKGSSGASNPDKGDPDGDIDDSDENVTLRFNPRTHSLEIISAGGTAQVISSQISDLSFQYYDAEGNITTDGNEVSRIAISVSGASTLPHPQTHQIFGLRLQSEVRIMT